MTKIKLEKYKNEIPKNSYLILKQYFDSSDELLELFGFDPLMTSQLDIVGNSANVEMIQNNKDCKKYSIQEIKNEMKQNKLPLQYINPEDYDEITCSPLSEYKLLFDYEIESLTNKKTIEKLIPFIKDQKTIIIFGGGTMKKERIFLRAFKNSLLKGKELVIIDQDQKMLDSAKKSIKDDPKFNNFEKVTFSCNAINSDIIKEFDGPISCLWLGWIGNLEKKDTQSILNNLHNSMQDQDYIISTAFGTSKLGHKDEKKFNKELCIQLYDNDTARQFVMKSMKDAYKIDEDNLEYEVIYNDHEDCVEIWLEVIAKGNEKKVVFDIQGDKEEIEVGRKFQIHKSARFDNPNDIIQGTPMQMYENIKTKDNLIQTFVLGKNKEIKTITLNENIVRDYVNKISNITPKDVYVNKEHNIGISYVSPSYYSSDKVYIVSCNQNGILQHQTALESITRISIDEQDIISNGDILEITVDDHAGKKIIFYNTKNGNMKVKPWSVVMNNKIK